MKKFIPLLALALFIHPAFSVCLDQNLVSGYHEPLDLELTHSVAVIVGKTVAKKSLMEDRTDSADITATLWRIKTEKTVRGKIAPLIDIYDVNGSGRFGFEIGKTYLLFVRADDKHGNFSDNNDRYYVSPCGSSMEIQNSSATLKQLQSH